MDTWTHHFPTIGAGEVYTSTVHLPHLYRMYTVTCGVYSTGYCTVFLVPIMVSSYVHAYERDAYVMTVPRYAYLST